MITSEYSDDSVLHNLEIRASKFSLLTLDEERELIVKSKAGNRKASETLYDCNIRLIKQIAKRYLGRGLDLEDLMQEGALGFFHAVAKFDLRTPFKLSTYATWWIRQYCSRAVANKSRTIRIPIHQQNNIAKVKKFYHFFIEKNKRKPSPIEIADGTGLELKQVEKLKYYIEDTDSLDKPIGDEDDSLTRLNMEMAPHNTEPEFHLESMMDSTYTRELLSSLSEKDRKLIEFYYGFLDNGDKTEFDAAQYSKMGPQEVKKKIRDIVGKLRRNADYHKCNIEFLTNLVIQAFEKEGSEMWFIKFLREELSLDKRQIKAIMEAKLPVCIPKVIRDLDPEKYKKDPPPGRVVLEEANRIKERMAEVGCKIGVVRI